MDAATFRAYGRFAADKDSLLLRRRAHGDDVMVKKEGRYRFVAAGRRQHQIKRLRRYWQEQAQPLLSGRWLAGAQEKYSIWALNPREQRNILFSRPAAMLHLIGVGRIFYVPPRRFCYGVAIDADRTLSCCALG